MAKSDEKDVAGCIIAIWQLFVTLPLFVAVLIGVLVTISPPAWVWVCAILYIPAMLIGIFLASIAKLLLE